MPDLKTVAKTSFELDSIELNQGLQEVWTEWYLEHSPNSDQELAI